MVNRKGEGGSLFKGMVLFWGSLFNLNIDIFSKAWNIMRRLEIIDLSIFKEK